MQLTIRSLFIILIFIFSSCKKDKGIEDNPIPPITIKPDTLSAGWSKIKTPSMVISSNPIGGDIYFKNSLIGYATAYDFGSFKTVDGGLNWSPVYYNGSKLIYSANIGMTPSGSTFFVAKDIYRTVDTGRTFSIYSTNSQFVDVFFTNNNLGLATAYPYSIMKTTDGGNTWTQLFSAATQFSEIVFMYDSLNAWVCAENKIARANGNLNNFILDSIPGTQNSLNILGLFATSPTTVYVGGSLGQLYKSINSGATWNLIKKFTIYNYNLSAMDIHFVSATIGYVSIYNRIYKTTDAGNTWTIDVALGEESIGEIHFTDANHGWALCSKGYILKFG